MAALPQFGLPTGGGLGLGGLGMGGMGNMMNMFGGQALQQLWNLMQGRFGNQVPAPAAGNPQGANQPENQHLTGGPVQRQNSTRRPLGPGHRLGRTPAGPRPANLPPPPDAPPSYHPEEIVRQTPLWVKVCGVITLVFLIAHLFGYSKSLLGLLVGPGMLRDQLLGYSLKVLHVYVLTNYGWQWALVSYAVAAKIVHYVLSRLYEFSQRSGSSGSDMPVSDASTNSTIKVEPHQMNVPATGQDEQAAGAK